MRVFRFAAVLVLLAALLAPARAFAAPALAVTPPMGWNNYNAYGLEVTETLIRETADRLVSMGLRDAGYVYVNIDDGWMASTRTTQGELRADPVRFPHGIKALADYVHAKGLKLGVYEDAGLKTCGGFPGSLGHERADAALFAAWGVDYLKYDNCYAGIGCPQTGCASAAPAKDRYAAMSDALAAAGRPIVLSLCSWGTEEVWRWARQYGNLWRTTGDIQPTYDSMLSIFKQTIGLGPYAGPNAWNDPDMLEVGNGMTATEDRTEVILWAMMAAPLIIGTDLTAVSPATLAVLKDPAVIAVDQDPIGRAATVVSSAGGHFVLTRPLADGRTAVVLFNSTSAAANVSHGTIRANLPPHGAALYLV
ncbi:glycoside hydrolase family 27 protein [Paractinoplanes atraurantiacus]|uniref:Alpha-galactosidase n=1 Tax=Paractinoplanes atraurantiacus TaxID=1036182 RepID=A0A285KCZ2_9ACTN|nr:glycoside hydrolase family 27 protein [Actinoplanes atraurantiacus]SNY70480.1 alpha-galactosidase [Actinoplanes atraurantiacus]